MAQIKKEELAVRLKHKKAYKFDKAAVEYAKLTDAQAQLKIKELKGAIRELAKADLTGDHVKMSELKELKTMLFWFRKNKNRSKYFKIVSQGASLRKYRSGGKSFNKPTGSNVTPVPARRSKINHSARASRLIKHASIRRDKRKHLERQESIRLAAQALRDDTGTK